MTPCGTTDLSELGLPPYVAAGGRESTEPAEPPPTIVNNFNAPVFNDEVHGVQLAWNNTDGHPAADRRGRYPR